MPPAAARCAAVLVAQKPTPSPAWPISGVAYHHGSILLQRVPIRSPRQALR